MTVGMILENTFVEADTQVYIRDKDMNVIASGNWYVDEVQSYVTDEAESFTWQDDDKVFIDLKDQI